MFIETERLVLKPLAATDYDAQCALWRQPDVYRYITGKPMDRETVWLRLLRDIGHWMALGQGNWSMRTRDTGAYVGSVGVLNYLREVEPVFDAPELGWGAAPAFQGQGMAREGLEAALVWADTVLDAPRTVCMISPDNTPSLKLAERVGYRPYADGTYKDSVVTLLERLRA